MPGIKDVAARAGVSAATVSRALSGNGNVSPASKRRVLDAAKELGFVLSYNASSLASGRSRNIGVVLPAANRWYFANVLDGAATTLLAAGYDLMLYDTSRGGHSRESVLTDFLMRKRLDGIIAVSLALSAAEVDQLLGVRIPVVGVGGAIPGAPSISINDFAVARTATAHLLSLGHRRIAHLSGSEEFERDFRLPTARRDGYEAAMRSAGLAPRPAWLPLADFTITGGYQAAKVLPAHPDERPTAVFAASDEMAIGTILAARELGLRVPDDLSVIGIDGHELGDVFGLTTFDQAPHRQGARAAQRLLEQLGGGPETAPHSELVEPAFIVRTSTTAPSA
ncbi:LacI family transcriptional regulator [Paenarthrobacter sp. DKR-5]|uniref:LacI family DNA-binding transcriptional regulator n=1 Tax=Paenarthrobacter sp. DKR-5 TaxID=2835535 RepID=UPI001BDD6F87|nr:LacI family DNA-binding transcriptional regulator [Paenarthrobacter sp. DKR-5]MBT1004387.1 LacI family transcriptional regulator [Paenarthrobacter sp. DKR-5]